MPLAALQKGSAPSELAAQGAFVLTLHDNAPKLPEQSSHALAARSQDAYLLLWLVKRYVGTASSRHAMTSPPGASTTCESFSILAATSSWLIPSHVAIMMDLLAVGMVFSSSVSSSS